MDVQFWIPTGISAVVLALLEWRRRAKLQPAASSARPAGAKPEPELSAEPDLPPAFGYKSLWLAVRASEPHQVATSLNLAEVRAANWRSGLAAADTGQVFVTPAVRGWVLVVSASLPNLGSSESQEAWTGLMQRASSQSADVQYFGTHRVVEYHAWARYTGGRLSRAFAYLGESGELLFDRGDATSEEIAVGMPPSTAEGDWVPDEETVLSLAAAWSVDPRELPDLDLQPSTGLVGRWRALALDQAK